jgi:hypothetical protein
MNRNALDLHRLMEELDEIQETGLFDVSALMDALDIVEKNPDIPKEKANEIVKDVKMELQELRRSSRIAGLKLKKNAQAAVAANVPMGVAAESYNRPAKRGTASRRGRSRSANKGRASRRSPQRRGRSRSRSHSRGRKYSRERAVMRNNRTTMRNNRTRNNKPNSEKLTGAAKDKSLYAQAVFIVENKAKIMSSTKTFETAYYKKQYDALVDFIRHYPGNAHIELLNEAVAVLKSNPAV